MRLKATFGNVILKVLPKVGSEILAAVKEEASDWCEIVDVGPECQVMKVGVIVLKPTGLYQWDDEDNDETYLVVAETDIVAYRVNE